MPRETPRKRQVYTDDDIVGRAPWAPVLDEEVWRSVVAKLTDPERRTNHADPAVRWLGSSIYQCPCGSGLRVNKSSEHAARPIYRCQQAGEGHMSPGLWVGDTPCHDICFARGQVGPAGAPRPGPTASSP